MSGDTLIEWDTADEAEVAKAREQFDRLKKEGCSFYEVAPERGKKVDRWNAKAGRLLAARPMAGGPPRTT